MRKPEAPADSIDARLVRELAAVLHDTGLSEIEVERDGIRVRVAKTLTATLAPAAAPGLAQGFAVAPAAPAPTPAAGEIVKSPMVGTVYFQAQPGAPPFAKVGDAVAEGQTLLLVEAMKTMNPIIAPRAGTVVEFLVADSQPVEFGESLVVIGPA
jgi:acetyl-CoA carboxylase biotin carboxyl carrier protein